MFTRVLLLITTTLTFLLINLGGYVHNTGSSLACPDWPLCYGQVMPEMIGGVLIEHSHRLLATLVGLCTVLIFAVTHRKVFAPVSLLALMLVIIQGLLGGITVILQLPPFVSTAHLAVAMLFFCCLIYLLQRNMGKHFSPSPSLTFITILLYLQILLGALLRHLGAGTACGLGEENIILCLGHLWPQSILQILHLFHRFLGISVAVLISVNGFQFIKTGRPFTGFFLTGLVLLQIWLGIEMISTGMAPLVTMLHLGGATLLLGTLWSAQFKLFAAK